MKAREYATKILDIKVASKNDYLKEITDNTMKTVRQFYDDFIEDMKKRNTRTEHELVKIIKEYDHLFNLIVMIVNTENKAGMGIIKRDGFLNLVKARGIELQELLIKYKLINI